MVFANPTMPIALGATETAFLFFDGALSLMLPGVGDIGMETLLANLNISDDAKPLRHVHCNKLGAPTDVV